MTARDFDVAIVGAGIAGASAGFALAGRKRAIMLERESQPGYHTTGRSAAMFIETYGAATVRAITKASAPFFAAPPPGFSATPLTARRAELSIGRADQAAALDSALAIGQALNPRIRRVTAAEARAMVPLLRPDAVAGAILNPDSSDIDVNALHRGYLRGFAAAGGRLATDTELLGLDMAGGRWRLRTKAGELTAKVVVNAAGAWCDEVARMAGLAPIGLAPKRRTAITFDPPPGHDTRTWPIVLDVEEDFYFRPDAGRIMASPADETPSPPCDAQPEEEDIAILIDKLERSTELKVKRIASKWAGLRSFVADRSPVAGFDAEGAGFFWLAGQGGFGIMTSPALGRLSAALIQGQPIPADIAACGVTAEGLSPARLREKSKPA
jgi:D-arginine dehydrogenase